jgi:hypothetical protein
MTQKFKIVAIVWLGRRSELWVRFGGKSFYRGFVMTRQRRPTIHSAVDKKKNAMARRLSEVRSGGGDAAE